MGKKQPAKKAAPAATMREELARLLERVAAVRGWNWEERWSAIPDPCGALAEFDVRFLVEKTRLVASVLCQRDLSDGDGEFFFPRGSTVDRDFNVDLSAFWLALKRAGLRDDLGGIGTPTCSPEVNAAFILGAYLGPLWDRIEKARADELSKLKSAEAIVAGKISGWRRRSLRVNRRNAERERLLGMCLHEGMEPDDALKQIMKDRGVNDEEYMKKRIGCTMPRLARRFLPPRSRSSRRHTGGIGACARQHAVAAPARPQPSISAVGGAVIRPVSRIRVWFGAPWE